MRALWLIAAATLHLMSGISAANPVAGLNDNPSVRIAFALDPFAEPIGHSVEKGDAKEKVLQRFGEPIEENISTAPTRFPGETYTSYEFRFEDLIIEIGESSDGEHAWVVSIEILGNAHELKSGIRIGSTRPEITAIFSPRTYDAKTNPMYVQAHILERQADVGEDGSTTDAPGAIFDIRFDFDADDRVSKVSITFSSD